MTIWQMPNNLEWNLLYKNAQIYLTALKKVNLVLTGVIMVMMITLVDLEACADSSHTSPAMVDKEAAVGTVDAVATNVETMTKDTLPEEEAVVVDMIASPETTMATILLILHLNSRSLTLTEAVMVASAVVTVVAFKVVAATDSRIDNTVSSQISRSQLPQSL